MKMTVKDFVEMDCDVDIVDDVCEDLYIAKCGAYELTAKAVKKFADVLDLMVEYEEDDNCAVLLIDDCDDWEYRLNMAIEFFNSLAGYCSSYDYDDWFIEK